MAKTNFEMMQELADLAKVHGPAGDAIVTDPEVDQTIDSPTGKVVMGKAPNPSPTYRYRFQDGTYLDVKTGGTATAVDYSVVGGTAGIKPGAASTIDVVNVPGKGQVAVDTSTLKPGQVAPGTEPVTAAPAAPDLSTTARNIWAKLPDGTMGWTPNPNYVAPRDPVADAINSRAPVTTPAQLKANAIAQGEALDQLNAARLARGEILGPADEAALKSKYDMIAAEYAASVNQLAAETKTREATDTATTLWDRGAADREAARLLAQSGETRANAGETRAQQAEARAAQQAHFTQTQAQAGVYTAQAEQGQGIVDQATKLGVRISGDEYKALYFDPHARALALLGQAMAGTDFDPHARALGLIGQQMQPAQAVPVAPSAVPQIYDSNPSGSGMGGQDPTAQNWVSDGMGGGHWVAPTVGPPRAPTLN